jgi:hypothetical protein
MTILKRCVVLGIAVVGLAGCDNPMFSEDRPGASDSQGGYYRGEDFCARNPDAPDCRR